MGLRDLGDLGRVQPGQRGPIDDASSGLRTFAVQIAEALGAEVTAVCGTRNVDLVRSLGADHVVACSREDFTRGERRYDVVFDLMDNRSPTECRCVLTPGGGNARRLRWQRVRRRQSGVPRRGVVRSVPRGALLRLPRTASGGQHRGREAAQRHPDPHPRPRPAARPETRARTRSRTRTRTRSRSRHGDSPRLGPIRQWDGARPAVVPAPLSPRRPAGASSPRRPGACPR